MTRHVGATSAAGTLLRALGAVVVMAVVPSGLAAQEPPEGQGPPQELTDLIFEREVFDYPTYERRDPFEPLTSTSSGPRFEQIRLRGIIYSPDPRRSVALLGTGTTQGTPQAGGGQTRRIRIGESWGNVRILEIHRDQIVVEVEEFGLTERRVLQLERRRGQGGS